MQHATATPTAKSSRTTRTARKTKPKDTPNIIERDLLTVKQVRLRLEISAAKVNEWADSGIIRCAVSVLSARGKRLRYFKQEDLDTPLIKKHLFIYKSKKLDPHKLAETCGQQRIPLAASI